jgi:hypothetical protein
MHGPSRIEVNVLGFCRHDDTPAFCFGDGIAKDFGKRVERECAIRQTLDKFQAGHLILLLAGDRSVRSVSHGSSSKRRVTGTANLSPAPSGDCADLEVCLIDQVTQPTTPRMDRVMVGACRPP